MSTEQRLQQLEDRIAIQELIDAYTYCADTRNIQGHMALFTEDTNFNGQSTIQLDGDQATGVTYCRAYHLKVPDGVQKLMIAGIRYYDTMVKQNGAWLFAERKLKVCWIENR